MSCWQLVAYHDILATQELLNCFGCVTCTGAPLYTHVIGVMRSWCQSSNIRHVLLWCRAVTGFYTFTCAAKTTKDTCVKDTANYCAWFPDSDICVSVPSLACPGSAPTQLCKFIADTTAFCDFTKKSECEAKKGCTFAPGTCIMNFLSEEGARAAATIAKNAGSPAASNMIKGLEQCPTYTTPSSCQVAKIKNSAMGMAQQGAVLVCALLVSLAAVMLF
jgi:hypothetical protein